MLEAIVSTAGVLALAFTYWLGYQHGSSVWREQFRDVNKTMLDNDARWRKQYEELSQEHFELAETFNNRLERLTAERVEAQIRSWEPDLPSIQDDFKRAEAMAEYMAVNRETINANRIHPPREDAGGEPARVGKVRLGKGRRRSA